MAAVAFLAAGFLAAVAFLAAGFLVVVISSFCASIFSSAFTSAFASTTASDFSSAFTEITFVAVFIENTFGPLSPSSFCTKPCFLAESCPSSIASDSKSKTNLIVFEESSFIGTKFVRLLGLLLVSTRP